jgi:hypothetical protein
VCPVLTAGVYLDTIGFNYEVCRGGAPCPWLLDCLLSYFISTTVYGLSEVMQKFWVEVLIEKTESGTIAPWFKFFFLARIGIAGRSKVIPP